MVRPSTFRLIAGAALLTLLVSGADAQTRRSGQGWHGNRSQYVGAGQIGPAPGSLARPAFSGIGSSSRANIDLLSSPAAARQFETPLPVFSFPRHDQWKWRYHRDHRHHDHDRWFRTPHYPSFPIYPVPYYDPVITIGTGLSVGSYGYSSGYSYPAYPSQTVGVMPLPAPALVYDPATGTYVYAYPNAAPMTTPAPTAVAVPAAPPPEPTPLELARINIRMGMPERAVSGLRELLLKEPDDGHALRLLGIALLQQKRFDDGIAAVRQAYRVEPTLAYEPLSGPELGLNPDELRRLVLRTVTYANRVDSGSAWLTVTALMQAEGREATARAMLSRVRTKGMETDVLAAMEEALKP